MVKHTYTLTQKTQESLRFFVLGMGIGLVIQCITLQPQNYQARLLRPTATSSHSSSASRSLSLREQRIALRVLRRSLLQSANNTGIRSFVVADATLHRAAELEEVSTQSSAVASSAIGLSAESSAATVVRQSVSSAAAQSVNSSKAAPVDDSFPAFDHTVFPFSKTPNWGAMHTPAEWNRTYAQMKDEDFVPIPPYSLKTLTIPLSTLTRDSSPEAVATITDKLFYSTRYFGAYDLDATEFSAVHPGVDLKLASGTPIAAIAGGRVLSVSRDDATLGLHVMIEHHVGKDIYISIYGHMSDATVKAGDTITPGKTIGHVGMTGNTSAPHLHLQVDRGNGSETHVPYWPASIPSSAEADKFVVNPITFIRTYASGIK